MDEDRKHILKFGLMLGACSLVFLAVTTTLVQQDVLKLYPKSTNAETLKGFGTRVEFTLRYQSLLIFWLVVSVLSTIYGRLTSLALNPLDDSSEHQVTAYKNMLTNSLESIVISAFSQLIFVSSAEPHNVLKFIPYINIIQFIGRIAFFAGYPKYRSFGYILTALPNTVLCLCNLYQLGSFMELY